MSYIYKDKDGKEYIDNGGYIFVDNRYDEDKIFDFFNRLREDADKSYEYREEHGWSWISSADGKVHSKNKIRNGPNRVMHDEHGLMYISDIFERPKIHLRWRIVDKAKYVLFKMRYL